MPKHKPSEAKGQLFLSFILFFFFFQGGMSSGNRSADVQYHN